MPDEDLTFSKPLYVNVELLIKETGEIQRQRVYMGDYPWMTDQGTFVINSKTRTNEVDVPLPPLPAGARLVRVVHSDGELVAYFDLGEIDEALTPGLAPPSSPLLPRRRSRPSCPTLRGSGFRCRQRREWRLGSEAGKGVPLATARLAARCSTLVGDVGLRQHDVVRVEVEADVVPARACRGYCGRP